MSNSQERKYFISQLNLKGTQFRLPNIINSMYIQQLGEMVPPPRQNTVGVCNQINLLILYYISSILVTLLKSP